MLIDWRKQLTKQSRVKSLYMHEIIVKKLSRVDLITSDHTMFIGKVIPNAGTGLVDCPDGVYLATGCWHFIKERPDMTIESGAICHIEGNNMKMVAQAAANSDWPLRIRDAAIKLLNQQPDPLAKFSEEELEKALAARRVNRPEKPKKIIVGKQVR